MTITLVENLPNRPPNALDIECTFNNGAPAQQWRLPFALGQPLPQNAAQFSCLPVPGVNLVTMPNIQSRTVIAHYPVAPITERFQVSSVHV